MPKALKSVLMIIVAVVVITAIVYAMLPQPIPVDTASVVVAPMHVSVNEEGITRIRERYVVSCPLKGRLRRVSLEPGDRVSAGETVLAVIEPIDPELLDARALAQAEARVQAAEAALRQAGASLERTRAAYDFAENELVRLNQAFNAGAANKHELDEARTNERTSTEDFRATEYGEEIAKYELEVARGALLYALGEGESDERARMPIYSPIDGAVLRVLQESVAVVPSGTPLIEVGDPRDLEIVIDVLSSDAVTIRPGQRVVIDHWGGSKPLEGIVRIVEPSAYTKVSALGIDEQRVNVIVDFTSSVEHRMTLGDGFRVEASIVIWEEPMILQIPTNAAFRAGDKWAVFVIVDGKTELREIESGQHNGRTTRILSGLNESEQIVLYPSDQLTSGARVEVRDESILDN